MEKNRRAFVAIVASIAFSPTLIKERLLREKGYVVRDKERGRETWGT